MPREDQMSIRPVGKVFREVTNQRLEGFDLTGKESAVRPCRSGLRRREIDVMQGQPGFELFDFLGLLHIHRCGGGGAAAAAIISYAGHLVTSRGEAGGVKLRGRTCAGNLASRGGVAVGQRIARPTACWGDGGSPLLWAVWGSIRRA